MNAPSIKAQASHWLARWRERHLFLHAWLKAPMKTGALLPSSRYLARHMARQIAPHRHLYVTEIGAGTGVFTRALLKRGVQPQRLVVVERERKLAALLRARFPQLAVLRGDAVHLAEMLDKHSPHRPHAVISGLPLRSLTEEKVEAILRQVAAVLEPGGIVVQFTYGLRSPVPGRLAKRLHLAPRHAGRVWLNFPPAAVWVYTKG